jgi:starch-binding outer membrane protein SusE/F
LADFGYSAAVINRLQIVKENVAFPALGSGLTLVNDAVENNVNTVSITQQLLNTRLLQVGGEFGVTETYKMRIVARVTDQLFSVSNVVTFTARPYNPIDEAEQLFVFGNFGAAAGFADWTIDASGGANTPVIYSPKNDGIYQGFVFMNVANPEFKLARIVDGVLTVKTVNVKYNPATQNDVLLGIEDSNPLGTNPTGTLTTSTPDSAGATITPPGTTNLAGPYYIIVDWNTNRYVMARRAMSIAGPPPNQVARPLTYDADPNSPFFGRYVSTNATVSAGQIYVQLRNNSSATVSRVERLTSTNSQVSQITLSNATLTTPNKLKFGGTNFQITQPGSYTFVLDLRNALDYNIIAIRN